MIRIGTYAWDILGPGVYNAELIIACIGHLLLANATHKRQAALHRRQLRFKNLMAASSTIQSEIAALEDRPKVDGQKLRISNAAE